VRSLAKSLAAALNGAFLRDRPCPFWGRGSRIAVPTSTPSLIDSDLRHSPRQVHRRRSSHIIGLAMCGNLRPQWVARARLLSCRMEARSGSGAAKPKNTAREPAASCNWLRLRSLIVDAEHSTPQARLSLLAGCHYLCQTSLRQSTPSDCLARAPLRKDERCFPVGGAEVVGGGTAAVFVVPPSPTTTNGAQLAG
jgi:hypothetical protein